MSARPRRKTVVALALTAAATVVLTLLGVSIANADPASHTPPNIGRVNVSGVGYVAPYENYVLPGSDAVDNVVYSGTGHITDTTYNSAGNVYIYYDRDISYCSFQVTPGTRYWYASALASGTAHRTRVQVLTWNVTDAGVEVPGNVGFNILATC